jgi:hypothetical protein
VDWGSRAADLPATLAPKLRPTEVIEESSWAGLDQSDRGSGFMRWLSTPKGHQGDWSDSDEKLLVAITTERLLTTRATSPDTLYSQAEWAYLRSATLVDDEKACRVLVTLSAGPVWTLVFGSRRDDAARIASAINNKLTHPAP